MGRKFTASWLVAGVVGAVIAFTPIVGPSTMSLLAQGPTSTATDPNGPISAETGAPEGDAHAGVDPLVPVGTDPAVPITPGYVNRNHDEGVTANGEVDLPF
jgi:hypothetical protein